MYIRLHVSVKDVGGFTFGAQVCPIVSVKPYSNNYLERPACINELNLNGERFFEVTGK